MPIKFDVKPRTVLLCDYSKGGFRAPEMVKRRPVIAISPRLRHRTGLVTVVPLSTTKPERVADHHCKVTFQKPLPRFPVQECWVKADMIATVSFGRLDLFSTDRDQNGKRKYLTPLISEEEFEHVKACIRVSLGF
ncbi:type II toxin-antitoxin system PemK/MazF family toxin [Rhodobacteraceae bacterium F11138]|nr:type II toxin-antitoxin system PemK/MazF family toxin [Rhodobacteraceae bacterium F11138]